MNKALLVVLSIIVSITIISGCIGEQTKTIAQILENPVEGEEVRIKGYFRDDSPVMGMSVCYPILIPTRFGVSFIDENEDSIAVNLDSLDPSISLFTTEERGHYYSINGTVTAVVRRYEGPVCEEHVGTGTVNITYLEVTDFVPDTQEVEARLCQNTVGSDGTVWELMRVEKCELNGLVYYVKDENTASRTDSGGTIYYSANGEEICQYAWFGTGACEEQQTTLENCEWESVCSTGGW